MEHLAWVRERTAHKRAKESPLVQQGFPERENEIVDRCAVFGQPVTGLIATQVETRCKLLGESFRGVWVGIDDKH